MTEDEKKKTANLEDVQAFGRIIHNKGIGSEGTCSTAAATATKAVTVGTTFKPVAGATLIVTFQNAITVANATLAVTYGASGSQQTLAAKPIYYRGSALAANLVEAGATLVLRYDGTNYNIIGSLQIDPFPSQSGNNGKFLKTNGSAVSWADIPSDNTKTDKLPMTGAGAATENNFMAIDANGNIKDSGKNENSFLTQHQSIKTINSASIVGSGNIDLQTPITDGASIGSGYGICETASDTVAKTATLDNYLLLKNMPVSIHFQKGINSYPSTLNINSKGAKPIFINGVALPPELIKANTTVTMVYDGTNYNIIAINDKPKHDNPLLVDMGLPSGRLWATRNIDITQPDGFAESPYQYGCSFFSWGNTDGHNPTAQGSFPYTFNSATYANTPGARITENLGLSYDAAHANLGGDWRMPTKEDFAELFAGIKYIDANGTEITGTNKLTVVNDAQGLYLQSIANDNRLFFPCSGFGTGQSQNGRGTEACYWSSSWYSNTHAYYMGFYNLGVFPQRSEQRSLGFTVRPVQ